MTRSIDTVCAIRFSLVCMAGYLSGFFHFSRCTWPPAVYYKEHLSMLTEASAGGRGGYTRHLVCIYTDIGSNLTMQLTGMRTWAKYNIPVSCID